MKDSSIQLLVSWRRLSSFWLALMLLAGLTAGCAGTFHEVRTLSSGQPPAERPTVLIIGEVQITDTHLSATDKEVYRLKFLEGVQAWFAKTNTFNTVLTGTKAPPNGVILSGMISEVNMGSAAARFWVGMGAGQERVQGEFELTDAGGQSLIRFAERKSYLGGWGIGGPDFLSADELTFRCGESVAENISNWLRGQKLE